MIIPLTDQARPLFNRLKEWRRERAMRDSVPPYVVFDNRQLAHIAVKAPESRNRLGEVEGVGKAKLEKYGPEILGIIRQKAAHPSDSAAPAVAPPAEKIKTESKGPTELQTPEKEDSHEP